MTAGEAITLVRSRGGTITVTNGKPFASPRSSMKGIDLTPAQREAVVMIVEIEERLKRGMKIQRDAEEQGQMGLPIFWKRNNRFVSLLCAYELLSEDKLTVAELKGEAVSQVPLLEQAS